MESLEPLFQVPENFRCGYVAIVGKPNAGKSTLLNALLGQKLSIVTHKAQTTRHRVLGIWTDEAHQIIFLDTPGIIEPKYGLHKRMMGAVDSAVMDADLVVFLVDASQPKLALNAMAHLKDQPALLVLNKMDLVAQDQVLPLIAGYMEQRDFEAVIPISALNKHNLDLLRQELVARLPLSPPFYPPDQVSEHPERFFIGEIIREKIFRRFHEEVPYATQVNVVTYEERPDRADFIDAEIVVERDSQKGMIIGKGGQALKWIGAEARVDIEEMIGKKVFLQLHVKVRSDWRNKDGMLNSFGYRI